MNRFLGLSIFLSLVLFSCSKSTEDKLVGSWDTGEGVTIKMNSDKTTLWSSSGGSFPGVWTFDEESMMVCLGENHSELDCASIISVDENNLCIEERGETACLNKVK